MGLPDTNPAPQSQPSEDARAEFQSLVNKWINFLQNPANIPLDITVSAHSDTFREELQIRAAGELVMVGMVRKDDDHEAFDVAAQTTLTDMQLESTTEQCYFFVANSRVSFFTLHRVGDLHGYRPVREAQDLDIQIQNDLIVVRDLWTRYILGNAEQRNIGVARSENGLSD